MVSGIVDLFFPPHCHLCSLPSHQMLCEECIRNISFSEPVVRCSHCYAPLEAPTVLCSQCVRSPLISAPHAYLFEQKWGHTKILRSEERSLRAAIASFLILLWNERNWPLPDCVIAIPPEWGGSSFREIASECAHMWNCRTSDSLYRHWIKPFCWEIRRRGEELWEEKTVMLIDYESSPRRIARAVKELWPAEPKEIYVLSVFYAPDREDRGHKMIKETENGQTRGFGGQKRPLLVQHRPGWQNDERR